ncbi:MAG: methyl-accepting chemotaxis protein [Myxococcota bacterium]
MNLGLEVLGVLVICVAAIWPIVVALRALVGPGITVSLFLRITPGLIGLVLSGLVWGRLGGLMNVTVTLVVVPIGMLIALLNLVFIGRSLGRELEHAAESLTAIAQQTRAAAAQVASSSNTLASGTTKQTASLQETSAAMSEVASNTTRNTERIAKASDTAREAREAADAGMADMRALAGSLTAMSDAAVEVTRIAKSIDEIAFQTNLLALNAAVEAARAGDAGAGFAVVAEEVRTLAHRAASAAQDTADRLATSTKRTREAHDLGARVTRGLGDIVERARRVELLSREVGEATSVQSRGVTQVHGAVGTLEQLTQGNAALAEQSAAAAHELEQQTGTLDEVVGSLMRVVRGEERASAVAAER